MPWFAAIIPAMGAAGGAAAGGAAAAGTAAAGAATAGSIATIGAGTAGAALTGASATGLAAAGAGTGWLATAANIASLAGTVGSTLSSVLSSGQNATAAGYEAKQLQYQAREQERITRRANQKQIAKAEAIGAASGVDIRSGSPLVAILDAIGESEREALAIRYGGQVRSDAAKRQASMSKAQIPGQLFSGLAQTSGILSKWWGK